MKSSPIKICHSCQAEIPSCEEVCPYCEQRQLTHFEVVVGEFFKRIFPKRYPASIFLMLSIVVVFICMAIDTLMQPGFGLRAALLTPPGEIALKWGAHKQGDFVWWRLITANFVHFGLIHFIFNTMALRYVVPYVERTFGSALTFANFVVLGTISMICSNVFGYMFGNEAVVAGSSGALMGFIGLAAVAAHREHTALSLEVRNSMIRWAAFTMVFGIIVNYSGSMGIDNLAHASGLVAGVLAGLVMPIQSTTGYTRLSVIRGARIAMVVSLLLVVISMTNMGMAAVSARHTDQCALYLKVRNFPEAEKVCAEAYRTDNSRVETYRNYIVISLIRNKPERARALCAEGTKKFSGSKDLAEIDQVCQSIAIRKLK